MAPSRFPCVVVTWSTHRGGRYLGSRRNRVTDLGCNLGLVYSEAVVSRRRIPRRIKLPDVFRSPMHNFL